MTKLSKPMTEKLAAAAKALAPEYEKAAEVPKERHPMVLYFQRGLRELIIALTKAMYDSTEDYKNPYNMARVFAALLFEMGWIMSIDRDGTVTLKYDETLEPHFQWREGDTMRRLWISEDGQGEYGWRIKGGDA